MADLPPDPPVASPPPGRSWFRRWLPALVVLGVLAVVAAAVIVPKVIGGIKAPTDAANRYLTALERDDLATGYAMLCAEGHRALTREAYREQIANESAQIGHLDRHRVTKTMADFNGHDATVQFTAKTARGTTKHEAYLVKEDGQWKWCGAQPAPDEKGINVHFP